jgi:hypothetical protein
MIILVFFMTILGFFNDDFRGFMTFLGQKIANYKVDWRDESSEKLEMGEIEELRGNKFPKGLVPLERIFDRQDMYKQKKDVSKPEDCVEINIGSKES